MENIQINKDLEKDNQKETNNLQEAEEGPFLSLIIKDLNNFYVRYDVNLIYLIIYLDNKFKSCNWN